MTDFYGGLLLGTVFGLLWNHVALKRSHTREAHWRHAAECWSETHVHHIKSRISPAIEKEEQSSSGYGEDGEDADGGTARPPSVYQELTPDRIDENPDWWRFWKEIHDGWVDDV